MNQLNALSNRVEYYVFGLNVLLDLRSQIGRPLNTLYRKISAREQIVPNPVRQKLTNLHLVTGGPNGDLHLIVTRTSRAAEV